MKQKSWIVHKPARGAYDPSCLKLEERERPRQADGEVLVRTLLLSLDPSSRNWLRLDPASSHSALGVGSVMVGMAVGEVVQSGSGRFCRGDLVQGLWGWEEFSVVRSDALEKIELPPGVPLETHLSIFSHIGRAAAVGLLEVGALSPSDTVVVSGAAGATGSLAAQIAKALGARVIGIAGGEAKCRRLLDEFGLDGAIDYKSEPLDAALRRECPDGIDLFFDNVGGATLDAVLENMAVGCRIVVCGAISQYDLATESEAYGIKNLPLMLIKQARMEGFVVSQFEHRYAEFDEVLLDLFTQGKLKHRAHLVDGIEYAAESLNLFFSGANEGKVMIRVASR